MLLALVAVGIGLVIGLAVPPASGRRFASPTVRWWWVLVVGVVLCAVGTRVSGDGGLWLLVAGYAVLIGGLALNVHVPGMAVLLVGLGMNAVVTVLNQGMPVAPDALTSAHVLAADEIAGAQLDGHRHLETVDDKMTILDDRVPVRLTHQVVSYGDIVLAIGLADVVAHLTRRRRRSPSTTAAAPADAQPAMTNAKPDHD